MLGMLVLVELGGELSVWYLVLVFDVLRGDEGV